MLEPNWAAAAVVWQLTELQGLLPVFEPASPEARALSELLFWVSILCAAILLLVGVLIVDAVIRYRGREGDLDPPAKTASYKVEIAWTAAPVVLLAIIFGFTLRTMGLVNPDPPRNATPEVVIRGHQWWWEATYPASGVVTANEIHIPVGRMVLARIESADVVHDFWAANLARKIDMIPGRENFVWLQADTAGTYLGRCAEYCGTQHAHMHFLVIAQEDSTFAAWQASQLERPAAPSGTLATQGLAIFSEKACLSCHSFGGTGGNAAPDLTHLASRRTIAAATLTNTPANLARWLRNPGAIKPGATMPNFQLHDGEIAALVAYLSGLR
ncbi:MAG: cytochrome c oxidase subunit II [Gemmatimonas sp.]|nr:cytochrome c oxidase subunit II [Gemmatimonas sp.]